MANPVDHEAVQAARTLCMLALDARQQSIVGSETGDDDCVIMHDRPVVRPVVHRYHPYRRPEPQQNPVTVAVTRRDAMAVRESMNERTTRVVSVFDDWNVFPLEDHEMRPDSPVPVVRRVIRNGVAVMEKVPLPYAQPSAVHAQVSPPIQRPSPLRQVYTAPPASPGQQPTLPPTPPRHPLPDGRPATIQQTTTDSQPSPIQSPSHAAVEDDAHTANQYSFRALTFQALLAAPEGELWSRRDVADWVEEQYPQDREQKATTRFRQSLGHALNQNIHMLEKCPAVKGERSPRYRLLSRARETATIIAWKTKQPPLPKKSDFELQGEPFIKTPYTWKSLVLQGLLAAPAEGWMQARELINYLATQYPHFLGLNRDSLSSAINMALNGTGAIVERSTQFGLGSHVFWRIAPDFRDEATRLAWPASATHREHK